MEIQPQVLPISVQWVNFVGTLIVSGLIIVGVSLALRRWYGRPRFIVGVPPFPVEKIPRKKIGHTSIRDQFTHKKDCFAVHLWEKQMRVLCKKRKMTKRDEKKLFEERLRCRTLHLDLENHCMLPIIAENCGGRAARDYILEIIFYEPRVHVIDVIRES